MEQSQRVVAFHSLIDPINEGGSNYAIHHNLL